MKQCISRLLIGGLLLASAVEANAQDLSGTVCKGPFSTGFTAQNLAVDNNMGAAWFETPPGSTQPYLWRKFGKEAFNDPMPASRKGYSDVGQMTAPTVKDGAIVMKTPTEFTWVLTATATPMVFTTKITGGKLGATGTLTCTSSKAK